MHSFSSLLKRVDTSNLVSSQFQTLLQEKDISPLTPYDSALPLLIKDPRYVLLPSLADRHAAFNEYCLEKSRAVRASKQHVSTGDPSSSSSSDPKAKAREAYEELLRDELKSTRTGWDEFRKQWKKDRRFFGFGRDDKEREKLFREWRSSWVKVRQTSTRLEDLGIDSFGVTRKTEGSGDCRDQFLRIAYRAEGSYC